MRVTFGVKEVCAGVHEIPSKKTLGLIEKLLRFIPCVLVGIASLPFQAKFTLNLGQIVV